MRQCLCETGLCDRVSSVAAILPLLLLSRQRLTGSSSPSGRQRKAGRTPSATSSPRYVSDSSDISLQSCLPSLHVKVLFK